MIKSFHYRAVFLVLFALLAAITLPASPAQDVSSEQTPESTVLNVYSSRHYDVDDTVYQMFEEKTGIKVNVVKGKSGELLERITREKGNPNADVFLTVGAETLAPLKQNSLLENFDSEFIQKVIPAQFRGDGWTGIMSRARIIAYSLDRVDPKSIKTYADLTKPEWKGKVLVRSSTSSYNVALLCSLIQMEGKEAAQEWASGIVSNMARPPKGNDRDQAKAVVAGEGDVAIMNSYYYVKMAKSSDPAEVEVSKKIGLLFPQDTHLNLSYGAVLAGAKNKSNAVAFLEFLTSEEVQTIYAEKNGEFPLNKDVKLPEIQASWGSFKPQKLDFNTFGEAKPEAAMIFDKAGWK